MTVGEALAAGRGRLRATADEGRFDALRLLEESLGRNAAWIVAHRDDVIDDPAFATYARNIDRRATGEPVAYIVGSMGFYGRTFAVTPDVLVPRPETEHVVALALAALRDLAAIDVAAAAPRICDVGTGSGILAITLACELPNAALTAVDVSPAALAVARGNAETHRVAERIGFVRGDTFSAVAAHERFACVVANLPYVKSADLAPKPDPTAFEPVLALDGGPDGLAAYRTLLAQLEGRLTLPGIALLEAGPDTTGPLAEAALAALPDAEVVVHRDYGGRERVVEVRRGWAMPSEKTDHP